MATDVSSKQGSEEADLLSAGQVLRLLLGRKKILFWTTFLAGVALTAIMVLMPNKYESSAALVVREPQVPLTGEAAPLVIEIMQGLTESIEIKKALFDRLTAQRVIPSDSSFRSFQKTLTTQVDRRPGGAMLPMIRLKATAKKDPEIAKNIANMWADIVTSRSKDLYMQGVSELSGFIDRFSKSADTDLVKEEDIYTSTLLHSNLAVSKAIMKQELDAYSAHTAQYLRLYEECESKEALLKTMRANRKLMEFEGKWEWAGSILWGVIRSGQDLPPDLSTSTLRLAHSLQSVVRDEQLLSDLEKETQLQFVEMDLKAREGQLKEVSVGIMDARNSLSKLEKQHEVLSGELAKMQDRVSLSKAITDDALFSAVLRGELQSGVKIPVLQTQERNPVYEDTKKAVVQMAGEIEGTRKRVEYYEKTRDDLKGEIGDLASRLEGLRARRAVLETSLVDNRDLVKNIRAQYQQTRNAVESNETTLTLLQARRDSKMAEMDRLVASIRTREKMIFTNEQILDALKRKVEDAKQVRGRLSAKAGEVALLTISAKQASRSGTTILFHAEANPLKVGPPRVRIVLGGALVVFVLLAFWIVSKDIILRQE
jgi:hypothetical protein